MLRSKDQAADVIKQFQQIVEAETGRKLCAFRSNRGGEFTEYCIEQGVHRQLTAPYLPQQNGVVECRNQTVVGTARCLLKSKELPGWLWGEVVATVVYLLNRSSMRSLEGRTSFEAWYGKKPGVQHLRTFRCVVHVKDTTLNLKKLDKRSRPMIFIGYEPRSKAYCVYNPLTRKVHVSRDVIFEEQEQWDWSKGGDCGEAATNDDTFTVEVEYSTVIQEGFLAPASPSPSSAPTMAEGGGGQEGEPNLSQIVREEDLDADHDDDAPLCLRSINDIIRPAEPVGQVRRVLAHELHAVRLDEPSSFEEAEQDPCWRQAMLEEMKSIKDNGTWHLADLPPGRRAIGLKWVFKVKRDEHGNITKHKARLVVKGYAQRRGIDYDEVFALVAQLDSTRLLIVLAVHQGW
jgi:hypothetical protein